MHGAGEEIKRRVDIRYGKITLLNAYLKVMFEMPAGINANLWQGDIAI
jgi:hypothetical protein